MTEEPQSTNSVQTARTGDETNLSLWTLTAVFATAAFAVMMILRARRPS